jgi:hypothetical protein
MEGFGSPGQIRTSSILWDILHGVFAVPFLLNAERREFGTDLRWQRLEPFQKLAYMLLEHLDGILNYCRTKVPFGVVEAIKGNIKTLLRRGRGYKNLGISATCCSKPNAWRSPRTNSSFFRKQPRMRVPTNSCAEPQMRTSNL